MTSRSMPAFAARTQSPEFTRLDSTAAIRRVQQLRSQGLADYTIAALVAWHVSDVRRAISSRVRS